MEVGACPGVAAVFDGCDVVYVGGYGTAWAEWLVSEDSCSGVSPLSAVVDALAVPVMGVVLVEACVLGAASSVDGCLGAWPVEAELDRHGSVGFGEVADLVEGAKP